MCGKRLNWVSGMHENSPELSEQSRKKQTRRPHAVRDSTFDHESTGPASWLGGIVDWGFETQPLPHAQTCPPIQTTTPSVPHTRY
jgi:hypothetical protein